MSGYVRIHRSLIGHPAFRNDSEALAFAWMVIKAAWKPTRVRYKERMISLNRGQLSVSVRDLATFLDRDKAWIERLLNRLKSETMVTVSRETGVSVITICNYDEYQALRDSGETLDETGARQGRDTEQRREEIKEENNKGGYAFPGRIIRLRKADLERWIASFPSLDVPALLQSRDDWFSTQAPEIQKRWFNSTSSWLAKKQQEAKGEKIEREKRKFVIGP